MTTDSQNSSITSRALARADFDLFIDVIGSHRKADSPQYSVDFLSALNRVLGLESARVPVWR